jgi:beta-lactam-binding protein with PASTA domain
VAKTVCRVPKLAGKSLRAARKALKRAHCRLGRVKKPKHSSGKLVVKSSSPRSGTVHLGGTKVKLTLKSKKR